MLTKSYRWTFVIILFVFISLSVMLSVHGRASAAPVTDPISNSCLTCHEDLYYLHDIGKYYCISEHTDRCVNCHEGNATVMKIDESHLGLIAHPQQDNGAKCQECHVEDAQARLAIFDTLGGYKQVMKAASYAPHSPAETEFPETAETNTITEKLPWVAGGILLFGFWLALVLLSPQKS